jgi:hypothetical protein
MAKTFTPNEAVTLSAIGLSDILSKLPSLLSTLDVAAPHVMPAPDNCTE